VTHDLDGNDLSEIRRRVVDPVLRAVTAQGVLTIESLSYELPPGWEGSWADNQPGPRRAWLVLSADEGRSRFEHPISKAMFWRSDAEYEAGFLASELDEWICLGTNFGWGGGRGVGDYVVPAAEWPRGRVLEVYPGLSVSLPLWERGRQVSADELRLPVDLLTDLISWREDLERVSTVMNEEQSVPSHDAPHAQRKQREAALRRAGYNSWREYVELFESRRDDVVERLRLALDPSFSVLTPPRIT
jgi:hypothetical protein